MVLNLANAFNKIKRNIKLVQKVTKYIIYIHNKNLRTRYLQKTFKIMLYIIITFILQIQA